MKTRITWRCLMCHNEGRSDGSFQALTIDGDPPLSEVFKAIRHDHAILAPKCPITDAEGRQIYTGGETPLRDVTTISCYLRFVQ